jgi:hypothetical protein
MAIRLYSNAQEEQVTQNGPKTLFHKQGKKDGCRQAQLLKIHKMGNYWLQYEY